MVARALLLVITALLLGGCGGTDDDAATTSVATTVTPVTTGATTEPVLAGASTEPAVWKSASDGVKLLTAVRAAVHPGFDRLVFEFRNGFPGYDVRYVEPPIRANGSGDQVPVAGGAVLVIRTDPALDADLTKTSAPRTYRGPTRFSPDARAIVEVVRTGGFEAVLTWAAGVDERQPFRVTRLESPARLVIDVAST
jgi:hypothetical protein